MKNSKLRNEIASFVSKKNICKRFVVVLLLTLLSSCSKEKLDGVSADFEKKLSNYKHINNGGIKDNEILPYNIDAITGATITIEGAGVYTSIPLSVREIENTTNGQVRGKYRDKNGVFNYEGLDLYYLLNDMKDGDNGIKLTDKSYKIILKNSNRENISEFTLEEVKKAHDDNRPIILSYGIADANENMVAPFVYDGKEKGGHSLGYVDKLKNDDGCIKLVYDVDTYGKNNYKEFTNVAYIYVAEEKEPGFKHIDNKVNSLYSNSQYVDYILTFRGSELKNEFTTIIRDIEALVKYNDKNEVVKNGLGYRDSYSLANNAYWYVNTYEGLDLYKYLVYLGMDDAKTMGLKKARTTLVKFIAADGAESNETFSIDTLSYPDAFGFYKKNSNDKNDGTYASTNEDLVKLGYPVLLAYGVNNYPYTISKTDEAYVSGLSNSGGPVHVVFGKTQYNHPNGSNQIQYLDTVVVGEDVLYNTHTYTDDNEIKKYKDDALNIIIKNENGDIINEKNITVEEIENLVYAENISKQDKKLYKVKDHYETNVNGTIESHIYEGVDLNNFLLEYIKITGLNGSIEFKNQNEEVKVSLGELFEEGYNNTLKRERMRPIIAFAKNGKALVKNENSDGYVDYISLKPETNENSKYEVKNSGGPLAILLPSVDKENYNGKHLFNVDTIVIKLDVDKYSHIYNDEDNLKNNKILFTGPGLEKEVYLTVTDIEEMQTKIKTMILNIQAKDNGGSKVYADRYRGMPLYDLFKIIGIKNNAADVTIEGTNGKSITVPLNRIKNKYEFIEDEIEVAMLAFGKRPDDEEGDMTSNEFASNGKALTLKDGGPIKFIIPFEDVDSTNADLFVENVTKVYVAANEIKTWSHTMSDVYSDFLDSKFTLVIKNDEDEIVKELPLKEIENMQDLIIRDKYYVLNIGECEGIDIFRLIKNNYDVSKSNLISVTFYAEDGYKNDVLSVVGYDALEKGIEIDGENKKVLLCYAINGYPLVDNENHEGYTGLAKNTDGPMRLIVENVQGASVKKCNKVVVTVSDEMLKK